MGSTAAGQPVRAGWPRRDGRQPCEPARRQFRAATTFPAADAATALVIDSGHAVLIASGAVFTEPVS